jgi:hypothetical protein
VVVENVVNVDLVHNSKNANAAASEYLNKLDYRIVPEFFHNNTATEEIAEDQAALKGWYNHQLAIEPDGEIKVGKI